MSLEQINYQPSLTLQLVNEGHFRDDPFFLLDVGCSGGLDAHWRAFGESLAGVGFDPLENECERLAAIEPSPSFSYVAAWLGWPEYPQHLPPGISPEEWRALNLAQFQRTTTARAQAVLAQAPGETYSEPGTAPKYTDYHTSIDSFLTMRGTTKVDFLKIDTDGSDLEVLLGAQATLAHRGVLGLQVESQFLGVAHDYANTWANIDRLLKRLGFELFDVDVYRCSRSTLPDGFKWDAVGVNHRGQVTWGECLYLRDPVAAQGAEWGLDEKQLLTLTCLFEIYGLNDCAVELLNAYRQELEQSLDVDLAIELLTAQWWPGGLTNKALIETLESHPEAFFRSGVNGQAALRMASARAIQYYPQPPIRRTVSTAGFLRYGQALAKKHVAKISQGIWRGRG